MKIKILEDVTIECDVPSHIGYYRDMEYRAKMIESWAKEFMAFVRDHRSQDPVGLHAIRVYSEVCSHCGNKWEEDADGPVCCNEAQSEHNTAKATP